MVCKKSLYCWKNGPCASDQTRRQIWEDNIRFRESLRDINQSDHYWSFQIYKNKCLCLEGEEVHCERPTSRKYRSASLQRLHDTDCTSITHDCNGLKFRNCFVHCPLHDFNKNSGIIRADTPVPQSLARKENTLSVKYPFRPLNKSDKDRSEYCHRYKNTLVNSCLKPNLKTKFLSQLNLSSLDDNKHSDRKILHSSCENIPKLKTQMNKLINSASKTGKTCNVTETKDDSLVQDTKEKETKVLESAVKTTDCQVQTDQVKPKKIKQLNPVRKCLNQENSYEFSPISRTTKKMLSENKKIPFATYGCNNSNLEIGSKRTHNVLASKLEVYPNALSAKQQKKDLIMKYIQSEKEFQRKCLPEALQRRINHSCLWSLDPTKKETKSLQKKNSKYLLPIMSKPLKKINVPSSQIRSGHSRTYCAKIKMESPRTSKKGIIVGSETSLAVVNCSPKNHRSSVSTGEEFGLYNLHRESSPNFRAGQDVLEVGWGDSPEPLNVEQKFEVNRSSLTCRKKLETKESPKSSIPFKRRNMRSTLNLSSKSIVDVAKYVAEVQELSKSIMKEFNAKNSEKDLFEESDTVSSKQLIENNIRSRLSPVVSDNANEFKSNSSNSQNKDPTFDNVLESFINEEDDWLSQALSSQEQAKTPNKGNFVKSKSENELTVPQSGSLEKQPSAQNCKNVRNIFRRTSSFDLTKPHNNYNVKRMSDDVKKNDNASSNQYSFQEIERKRLEAKYRRERREIERKKLEALKKLEMKKLKVIKT